MALAFSVLVDDPDTAAASSYATPAVTPTANASVLLIAQSSGTLDATTPAPDVPSWLSGSWTLELEAPDTTSEVNVWSGRVNGSPGSDDITVDFDADAQTGCHLVLIEITGEDDTDLVIQSKLATGSGTSGTVTLDSALGSANNAILAAFFHLVNEAHAPTGGETEIVDSGYNTPTRRLSVSHKLNTNTAGASWATTGAWGAVAFEIKAAAGAVTETPTPGGATAGGNAPTARVGVASGGALVQGLTPAARVPTPTGGAVVQGVGPAATVTAVPTPGGVVAGGVQPTARGPAGPGGVVAGGQTPAPRVPVAPGGVAAEGGPGPIARVTFTAGGAVLGGFAPSASGAPVTETPTPGGLLTGGIGPTARVGVSTGGAVVSGPGPSARTVVLPGGATAQGVPPIAVVITTLGGALTGGFGLTARVPVSPGGVIVGGNDPSEVGGAFAAPPVTTRTRSSPSSGRTISHVVELVD